LAAACESSSRSYSPLPNEQFDAAHEAYERSSSQQKEIVGDLRRLVAGVRSGNEQIRMLSVGPGRGMLDLPLIRSLAGAGVTAQYVGVDPNPVACRRFLEGFEVLDPDGVSLDLRQCGVDDLPPGPSFDLIHAVHSLYYVDDPAATVDCLFGRLAARGRLVLYQAPHGALNALAELFWRGDRDKSIWFSDRLESWLIETGRVFEKRRISASLDVTGAFDREDPRGRLILDFILQTKSCDLDAPVRAEALECLRAMSRYDGGRWLAPHPVDSFVVFSG